MTCLSCQHWRPGDCEQGIPGFPRHNPITCPAFCYEPGSDEAVLDEEMRDGKTCPRCQAKARQTAPKPT